MKDISEAYWTCCGIRYPYTTYRCTKCGGYKDKGGMT